MSPFRLRIPFPYKPILELFQLFYSVFYGVSPTLFFFQDLSIQGDGNDLLDVIDAKNSNNLEDDYEPEMSVTVEKPLRTATKRRRTTLDEASEHEYSHSGEYVLVVLFLQNTDNGWSVIHWTPGLA